MSEEGQCLYLYGRQEFDLKKKDFSEVHPRGAYKWQWAELPLPWRQGHMGVCKCTHSWKYPLTQIQSQDDGTLIQQHTKPHVFYTVIAHAHTHTHTMVATDTSHLSLGLSHMIELPTVKFCGFLLSWYNIERDGPIFLTFPRFKINVWELCGNPVLGIHPFIHHLGNTDGGLELAETRSGGSTKPQNSTASIRLNPKRWRELGHTM